jgi:cyanophycin synthetase
VPAAGLHVTLRFNASLSTGGTSKDVTDSVHPAVARMCTRAVAVAGLDVCGIDLRLRDISQPPTAGDERGAVIEINSSPGLRMHLSPSEGPPRDVAGRIVDQLYPPGTSGRVPIVSVTGTNVSPAGREHLVPRRRIIAPPPACFICQASRLTSQSCLV